MKPKEQTDVIELLAAFWPQVSSWPDRTLEEWRRGLRLLSHTWMVEALHALREDPRYEFPPSWGKVFEEYNHTERMAKARQRSLAAGGMLPHADPADYPLVDHRTLKPSPVLVRLAIGRVQQEISRMAIPIRLHDHTRSDYIESCPVCSLHDHDIENRHVADCVRCENFDIVAYDLIRTRFYNNPRWTDPATGKTLAEEWREMDERGEEIPVRWLPDRSLW